MAASGPEGNNGTNTVFTDAISLGNEGQERPSFPLNVQGHNTATTSGTSLFKVLNEVWQAWLR